MKTKEFWQEKLEKAEEAHRREFLNALRVYGGRRFLGGRGFRFHRWVLPPYIHALQKAKKRQSRLDTLLRRIAYCKERLAVPPLPRFKRKMAL